MSDRFEQEAINKLTSVSSALKNPFKNLEDVLAQLGKLERNIELKEDKIQNTNNTKSVTESKSRSSSDNLKIVLTELGEMFRYCRNCKKGTLKDELIAGLCFECYHRKELINAENDKIINEKNDSDLLPLINRVDELEAQIKDIESKYQKINSSPRDYMNDIIEEILFTIRRDIEANINSIRNKSSSTHQTPISVSNVPPPPPPPPMSSDKLNLAYSSEIDFSKMSIDELKNFTPDFLESLPITQRNKYNARIKELQSLEKMTQEQKKKYFEKKKLKQKQNTNLDDLRNSLIDLSYSNNPLFEKMRKQAENSVLVGKGTLGKIGPKLIYIHCYNCNKTVEIVEGDQKRCKYCNRTLDMR